ncbi:hypothetical protein PP939_gp025 [Rhizobium phage RL38J1]|uniref:Uncharacterized protein n=1 Tax=Rhizobium phage RL38J1 TaxID=2663232 RepID=A0A6B9J1A5_9CAUD|nr:hypothetical protein PP939_gp025 [Rhizobium phage RL38J1]QGZ14079.1 hypothetical protein RL38J1_025 [Rhizobium phage RL38J1]
MKTCCYVLEPAIAMKPYKLCGKKSTYSYKISIESGLKERVYTSFCEEHLKEIEKSQDEEWN